MFRAPDSLYEESPAETMREYLSDANPYIFKDREPAVPSIGVDFSDMRLSSGLHNDIPANDAYSFVKNYLKIYTDVAAAFDDISLSERSELCDIVTEEESTTA